ncbi:hypothetical protein CPB86DRAFT_830003 [Serendipita vermifera]|nr:hypothetical protein CPB86DRAFT_830003 [Serendipita vermifera]
MSEEFCHITSRSQSPVILDTPPPAPLEDDGELSQLVEDFMRATQLQISLKQRIESYLEKKEKEAEEQEEKARLLWVASQANNKARHSRANLLREKMKQAESMGKPNKEIADHPPPMTPPHVPISSNEDTGRALVETPSPAYVAPVVIGPSHSPSVPSYRSKAPGSPPPRTPPSLSSTPPPDRSSSPPKRSPSPPVISWNHRTHIKASAPLSSAPKPQPVGYGWKGHPWARNPPTQT